MKGYASSPTPGMMSCLRCCADVPNDRWSLTEHSLNTCWVVVRDKNMSYNQGADGKCGECGATVKSAEYDRHAKWHKEIKESKDMSGVRWCDFGNHAFKAGAPGSGSFNATIAGANGPETIEQDACAEHSPFRADVNVVRQELEAAYPVPKAEVKTHEEKKREYPSAY